MELRRLKAPYHGKWQHVSSGLSQHLCHYSGYFFSPYNSWLTCLSPPQRIFLEKMELILLLLFVVNSISFRYLVIVYWMNEWALMSTELWWQIYFYLKLQNHDWSLSQKQIRHPFLLQSACSILRLCAKFPVSCLGTSSTLSSERRWHQVLSVLNERSAQVTSLTSLPLVSLMIHQLEISQALVGLPPGSFIYICSVCNILNIKKKLNI